LASAVAAAATAWDAAALLQTRVARPGLEPAPEPAPEPYRQALENIRGAQYVASVELGGQAIEALPDTGSYELVVFGADCESCGREHSPRYFPRLSRSFSEGVLTTEQSYSGGRLSSQMAHDDLSIGPLAATNQSFWNVKFAELPASANASFEALLGLGPPEAPAADAWDLADAAVANITQYYEAGHEAPDATAAEAKLRVGVANELSKNMPPLQGLNCLDFSLCFGARPGSGGVLVWNDRAAEEQPELFSRVPVVGNHSWSVNLSNVRLDEDFAEAGDGLNCSQGCSALLDSGTSLLGVPSAVAAKLAEAVDLLDESCSNINDLPDLAFELGGTRVTLPPTSYVAELEGQRPHHLWKLLPWRRGRRSCQLAVFETNAMSSTGPLWILGMPFFREYYTTFTSSKTPAQRSVLIAPHTEAAASDTFVNL